MGLDKGETHAHLDFVCELLARENPRKLAHDLTLLMHTGVLIGGEIQNENLRMNWTKILATVCESYPVAGVHMMKWLMESVEKIEKGGQK